MIRIIQQCTRKKDKKNIYIIGIYLIEIRFPTNSIDRGHWIWSK